jgi:hypothetical protein
MRRTRTMAREERQGGRRNPILLDAFVAWGVSFQQGR